MFSQPRTVSLITARSSASVETFSLYHLSGGGFGGPGGALPIDNLHERSVFTLKPKTQSSSTDTATCSPFFPCSMICYPSRLDDCVVREIIAAFVSKIALLVVLHVPFVGRSLT